MSYNLPKEAFESNRISFKLSKEALDEIAIENTDGEKKKSRSRSQRRKSKLAKLLTVGRRSSSFEGEEESKHLSVKDHKRYVL